MLWWTQDCCSSRTISTTPPWSVFMVEKLCRHAGFPCSTLSRVTQFNSVLLCKLYWLLQPSLQRCPYACWSFMIWSVVVVVAVRTTSCMLLHLVHPTLACHNVGSDLQIALWQCFSFHKLVQVLHLHIYACVCWSWLTATDTGGKAHVFLPATGTNTPLALRVCQASVSWKSLARAQFFFKIISTNGAPAVHSSKQYYT